MKVLVLGNSDTRGLMVEGPTWAQLARDEIEAASGERVEYADRGFVPAGRAAADYAERLLEAEAPDVVIVPLTDFVFLVGLVEQQVRHRFGERAAGVYRRLEQRFDAATGGTTGTRGRANDWGRRLARTIIGTRPLATVDDATAAYAEVFNRLARAEQLQVVVVAYPLSPSREMRSSRRREARRRFHQILGEEAARHRFRWVGGDEALRAAGATREAFARDGTHMSPEGHRSLGAAVAAELRNLT